MPLGMQVNAHADQHHEYWNLIGWGEWPQEDKGADSFDLNQNPIGDGAINELE
jgi:hypothetical protein